MNRTRIDLVLLLAAPLALATVGCGDDGEAGDSGSGSTGEPATTTDTTGGSTTEAATGSTTAATDSGSDTDGETDAETESDTDDGPQPAGPDFAPDPSTFGPYPVGVLTIELEDDTRGEDGPRPIVAEIWYPATDAAIGGDGVVYEIDDLLRPEALELLGDTEVSAALSTTAVRDADMRLDDGPYPVVMFSHGSGGMRMQSTYLTVVLASHGYVVVSPDHYNNTLSDALILGEDFTDAMLQSFQDRPMDLDFLVDHMSSLDPTDPLAAASDLTRVGVAGHSFGALTSLRWLGQGTELKAVVAQAPPSMELTWLGLTPALATHDTPVMLHVGGVDATTPPEDAQTIWDEASAPRSRLILERGGHFTFSDMCQLDPAQIASAVDLGIEDALEDGCTDENTDPEAAAAVMRHFAIGHFNAYLRDSPPSLELLTQEAGRELAGDEVIYESDL